MGGCFLFFTNLSEAEWSQILYILSKGLSKLASGNLWSSVWSSENTEIKPVCKSWFSKDCNLPKFCWRAWESARKIAKGVSLWVTPTKSRKWIRSQTLTPIENGWNLFAPFSSGIQHMQIQIPGQQEKLTAFGGLKHMSQNWTRQGILESVQ